MCVVHGRYTNVQHFKTLQGMLNGQAHHFAAALYVCLDKLCVLDIGGVSHMLKNAVGTMW